jgi:hypothetical protein
MLAFYKQYLMPAMTREDQRDVWGDLRREVVLDLANATDQTARTAVFKLVGKFCLAIIPDERYDPATRYNCILLLGELNGREASGNKPPVPFAPLLPKLMEPFQKEDSLPLLRHGAIMGILRHAELTGHPQSPSPMKPAVKEELAKLMVKVVNDDSVPAGVEASAHDWMRGKAVETLGYLYLGSEDVVNALGALLVDEKVGLDVRCNAAEAIGRIAGQIDPAQVEDLSGRMAKLTYDCVKTEFLYLKKQATQRGIGREQVQIEQRPSREGYPGQDTQTKKKDMEISDPRTIDTRRRLLFQLLPIQNGLTGNPRSGITGLAKISGAESYVSPVETLVAKLIESLQEVDSELPKLGHTLEVAYTEELPQIVPEKLKQTKAGEENAGDEEAETATATVEQPDAASGTAPS